MDNMENKDIETVEAEVVEAEVVESNDVEAPVVEEAAPAKKKANVLAILSLVIGILGIVFSCPIGCCYYVAPVFAIAAIILGAISPKNEDGKRTGLAKAGLICGIVTAVLSIAVIIIAIAAPALLSILGMASEMNY